MNASPYFTTLAVALLCGFPGIVWCMRRPSPPIFRVNVIFTYTVVLIAAGLLAIDPP